MPVQVPMISHDQKSYVAPSFKSSWPGEYNSATDYAMDIM